ncbi:MAG: M3 family oligoendopeptidase [Treponema sp.]|nr:M3 family oligoendopeptidase [Candidatus Treponema equifaecale]
MSTNLNTPRWNLDSIYTSIDSAEYKQALSDFSELSKKIESHLNNSFKDFSLWLKIYIELSEKHSALAKTLNAYAYLIYSVDTTNTKFLNNISTVEELLINAEQLDLQFIQILNQHKDRLPEFFVAFPQFEEYKYLLQESLNDLQHQMSPQEEKLASELQQTGGNAWDRLHEQIISNLKDSETGKTFNQLRNDAYSSDPELRFDSYKKEIQLLKQNEIALAASLNNLKGETITLNSHRNYSKAIHRTLDSSRMSEKTLNALISAIEKSLPQWRKYFAAKGKFLRNNNQTVSKEENGISFYDLFAPLSNPETFYANQIQNTTEDDGLLSKTWTFSEAMEYVIQKYNSFSKEMGDFAEKAWKENWIDAEVRSGKVGGAYDEDIPLGHQSRIMTNFTGAFSDVITLAHEIGHAYHFSCMKGQPASFFDYPMTLAETASTFAETILKQDVISNSEGFEKLQALELDLQDTSQVLVDILCRFYFEKSVFEQRENNELNAEDFCNIMLESQNKTYGEGLNSSKHEYMWAVKSHYYSTGLDFYNFPYAFGQLFAISLYQKYKNEGSQFAETYKKILSKTGNMSCEALCKLAGFDIESEEFWSKAISFYTDEISEFEELIK